MSSGIVKNPPWLMWGNSQTLTIPAGIAAGNPARQAQQLIKIVYKRPTTWNFLFAAKILSVDQHKPVGGTEVIVDFNLTTGIGRSTLYIGGAPQSVAIPGFCRLHFVGNPIDPTAATSFIWTTTCTSPPIDQATATPVAGIVSNFVGQDVNVNVNVLYVTRQVGADPLVIQIDGYLSPFEHIRPEWFKGKMGQEEDEGH